MSEELKTAFVVSKFDGTDFPVWKRQVLLVLGSKKLTHLLGINPEDELKYFNVDGNPKDSQKDIDAQVIIFNSLTKEVGRKVVNCKTAKEMWSRMLSFYQNNNQTNVHRILEKYYSYKKEPSDDIKTHVGKVEELVFQLEEMGQIQTEESIISKLIMSLSDEYKPLKSAWDSVHPGMKTKQELIARMMKEEDGLNNSSRGTSELLVMRKPSEFSKFNHQIRKQMIEEKKKSTSCNRCGKIGHWARECRNNPTNEPSKNNTFALVANCSNSDRSGWVIDSGASRHACNDRKAFRNFRDSTQKIQVGNSDWMEAVGCGDIYIECRVRETRKTLILTEVLYVPELSRNLLSCGTAAKKGAKSYLSNPTCEIIANGEIIAIGYMENSDSNLYILDGKTLYDSALIFKVKRSENEWHRVLGHADPATIRRMDANNAVDGFEIGKDNVQCSTCPMGKAIHSSHPTRDVDIQNIGDVVAMDLVGPMNTLNDNNNQYALILKDRFSDFSFVYNIKTKDEVFLQLTNFIADFETGSGKQVKCLETDNGSEFNNQKVRTLCAIEKIKLSLPAPYTPQQNGTAERNNRTILETARTMLISADLGQNLWPEAMETAVYLRNRVLKQNKNKTPYEIFTGKRPYIGHLVPFGTKAQALITNRRIGKFDAKTEKIVVIGFTERRNTYKVYSLDNHSVRTTSDVIFTPFGYQEIVNDNPASGGNASKAIDAYFENLQQNLQSNQADHQQELEMEAENISHNDSSESIEIERPPYSPLSNISKEFEPTENEQHSLPSGSFDMRNSTNPFLGNTIPRSPTKSKNISLNIHELQTVEEPQTYYEAVIGPNSVSWIAAINEELDAHKENQTWEIVNRPQSGTTLSAKWVFKLKRTKEGVIDRFKARLVARGFTQKEGIDFKETYSPVARSESIRTLLAICAQLDFKMKQFDIATAFLNGEIDEDIYMESPPGLKLETNTCLKLRKSLYGLKQAPRAWNIKLNQTLEKYGFNQLISDPCIYANKSSTCYLAIYVDDGLIISPTESTAQELINNLSREFKVREVTGNVFLGMEIIISEDYIRIGQQRYISDLLKKFNMDDCIPVSTPIAGIKALLPTTNKGVQEHYYPYREAIGSLLYCATMTRPDILFPLIVLSRYNQNPSIIHWQAIKRILRYLKGTKDYCLEYQTKTRSLSINAYSDADWAGDEFDRKSTSGIMILLGGGPIIFGSRQQAIVALSSTEAEFVAACEATKEIMWLTNLLDELNLNYEKPCLHIDNRSTIRLIKNNEIHRRSKHIDIKFHFIREKYATNLMTLENVCSEDQIADFLTKQLCGPKLKHILTTSGIKGLGGAQELLSIQEEGHTHKDHSVGMHQKDKSNHRYTKQGGFNIACFLLSILITCTLISPTISRRFEKVGYTIWQPTDHHVEEGIISYDIYYRYVSPCQFFYNTAKANEGNRFLYNINKNLHERCVKTFHEVFIVEIDNLLNKKQLVHKQEGKYRKKRFIPVIIGAVSILCASNIYDTATKYLDPQSDHNRLYAAETKLQKLNEQFEIIKVQTQQQINLINNNLITSIEGIGQLAKATNATLENLGHALPEFSWAVSMTQSKIEKHAEYFREVSRLYIKGLVSTKEMGSILNDSSIMEIDKEDTNWESVERINNQTLNLKFISRKRSPDTFVYEVDAVSHWVNLTTKPVFIEYAGPKYIVHNTTSNCTKGIDKPKSRGVYTQCLYANQSDTRLKAWIVKNDTNEAPTIVKLTKNSYIYCTYNNVTINGSTYSCPPFMFKLPITQEFETTGHKHANIINRINIKEEITATGTVHEESPNELLDDELNLLKSIRKLNNELGEAFKEKESSIMIHIPSEISFKELTTYLSIGSALLSIFFILFRRHRSRRITEYAAIAPQIIQPAAQMNFPGNQRPDQQEQPYNIYIPRIPVRDFYPDLSRNSPPPIPARYTRSSTRSNSINSFKRSHSIEGGCKKHRSNVRRENVSR